MQGSRRQGRWLSMHAPSTPPARAAIFVGEAEASWFGGGPGVYVVYPDTRSGEEVAVMRIVPREDDE